MLIRLGASLARAGGEAGPGRREGGGGGGETRDGWVAAMCRCQAGPTSLMSLPCGTDLAFISDEMGRGYYYT